MNGFPIKGHPTINNIPMEMVRGGYMTGEMIQDAVSIGGVTPAQAVAILENRAYHSMPWAEAAARLKELVDEYQHGRIAPIEPPSNGPAALLERLTKMVDLFERARDNKTPITRAHCNELLVVLQLARQSLTNIS